MADFYSKVQEKKRLIQTVKEQEQREVDQELRDKDQKAHQRRMQELKEQNRQREALVDREEEQMRLRQEMLAEANKMQNRALHSAKLSQGLQIGSIFKMAVANFYQLHERLPESNQQASLEQPKEYAAGMLAAAEVRHGGVIALLYTADSDVKGGEVYLLPSERVFGLTWACKSPDYRNIEQLLPSCSYALGRY